MLILARVLQEVLQPLGRKLLQVEVPVVMDGLMVETVLEAVLLVVVITELVVQAGLVVSK